MYRFNPPAAYICTGEPRNVVGNFYFQQIETKTKTRQPCTRFQGRSACGSAAQKKLCVVLFLQGHRRGFVWLMLVGIDLHRWLIMWVWFDVAEHPLLSQGWWSSLLLSQLSPVMDELSTSSLHRCLRTYLIPHPENLQPLVGILISLHALWLG